MKLNPKGINSFIVSILVTSCENRKHFSVFRICLTYVSLRVFKGLGQQGTRAHFFGNRGTKPYKLEAENIVSKFIKRGTNYENVW